MANEITEITEIAFGSYYGCERCGLYSISDKWDCVCDLLLENGNCPGCLFLEENCRCDLTLTTSVDAHSTLITTVD